MKVSVLHAVVLVSFYRFTDASDVQLLVAPAYQAVASIFFFGMILIDQLRRAQPARATEPAGPRNELVQTPSPCRPTTPFSACASPCSAGSGGSGWPTRPCLCSTRSCSC